MKTSPSGIALIESFEGCKLTAYEDSVGIWTIGYGHTNDVKAGDTCTQRQADVWLAEDVVWAERCVERNVTVQLTQNQFDALVSWTFNLGCGSLRYLLPLLNAGANGNVAMKMREFDHAGGKKLAGLTRRREAEVDLFMGRAA